MTQNLEMSQYNLSTHLISLIQSYRNLLSRSTLIEKAPITQTEQSIRQITVEMYLHSRSFPVTVTFLFFSFILSL